MFANITVCILLILKMNNQLNLFPPSLPLRKYGRVKLSEKQYEALEKLSIVNVSDLTFSKCVNAGGFKHIGNKTVKKLLLIKRQYEAGSW